MSPNDLHQHVARQRDLWREAQRDKLARQASDGRRRNSPRIYKVVTRIIGLFLVH